MERSFRAGDTICLSIPTAGKLDPRWQRGTLDCAVSRSPATLEIVNGRKRKIVHVNRIHREIQPQQADPCSTNVTSKQWCQPQIATLFSQKIHQTRVLLDILDGFDIHKIDCNIRLKDKPSIKGSSVIYCIVIDIYLYD